MVNSQNLFLKNLFVVLMSDERLKKYNAIFYHYTFFIRLLYFRYTLFVATRTM
ncbi:hypothetical protein FORC61_p015 (plasmid) [Staphylococcus aureus]|nr:hypothetical protein FORC61_p015 [Staphylococcus aureus]